jgi:hypothetical protein
MELRIDECGLRIAKKEPFGSGYLKYQKYQAVAYGAVSFSVFRPAESRCTRSSWQFRQVYGSILHIFLYDRAYILPCMVILPGARFLRICAAYSVNY